MRITCITLQSCQELELSPHELCRLVCGADNRVPQLHTQKLNNYFCQLKGLKSECIYAFQSNPKRKLVFTPKNGRQMSFVQQQFETLKSLHCRHLIRKNCQITGYQMNQVATLILVQLLIFCQLIIDLLVYTYNVTTANPPQSTRTSIEKLLKQLKLVNLASL